MESIQLFLNDRLVSITAKSSLIQQLRTDDAYLSEYITNAVKSKQFTFLNESDLNKLTVKRAIFTKAEPSTSTTLLSINKPTSTTIAAAATPTTSTPITVTKTTTPTPTATTITTAETAVESPSSLLQVWCRKGKPSDDDLNATSLLLQLRGSEKYVQRFNDKKSMRLKLWDEIANEIRETAGYDVDATKCQQKFLNMTKTHVKFLKRQTSAATTTTMNGTASSSGSSTELKPPEFFDQMNEILHDKINNSLLFADNDDGTTIGGSGGGGGGTTADSDDEDDDETDGLYMKKKRKLCGTYNYSTSNNNNNNNSEKFLTDVQFDRLYSLFEERTKLMRERNQQTGRLLNLFERLIDKFE